jgi:hypothetical protein
MNSQISKISEIMENIKQHITDNQHKITMESLMELRKIESKINTCIYTQNKFDEMPKIIVKIITQYIK